MATALLMKSWRDLSQKKARTAFTLATIALAVMGLSLFAVSPMASQAALDQIEEENIFNLEIIVSDVELTPTHVSELGQIDNVEAFDPKTGFVTRMYIGERRNEVLILGVPDFENIAVNKISKTSGSYPGDMEVLTERSNKINGVYDGKAGDAFRAFDHQGNEIPLTISGEGKSLAYAGNTYGGTALFYTDIDTVRTLSNLTGYNILSFTLEETDDASMEATVEDIRDYLVANTDVVAFSNLPETRASDENPMEEFMGIITSMLSILTLLALLCSVFLISNTMNTLISEQKREIAQMKAIGASQSQVFRSFLTTAIIMGIVGTVLGVILGIFVANFVMATLGDPFGFEAAFIVYLPNVLMSLGAGIGIVIAASLPALFRSSRLNVREGLQDQGISVNFGEGAMDRFLMRAKSLPRTVQMGLRNVARKKGRSIATVMQVALAVGLFMGLVAFGNSLIITTQGAHDDSTWNISVEGQQGGGTPLTEDLIPVLEDLEGVSVVEPTYQTAFEIKGESILVWSYVDDTMAWNIDKTMDKGRWFTSEEHSSAARVMIVGPALSARQDLDVGDSVEVMTATGPAEFEVVGVTNALQNNGILIFTPVNTLQDVLRANDTVTGFYIATDSEKHDDIDRTATTIEDEMLARGYMVTTPIQYVLKERNVKANQGIISLLLIISTIVVFISMIGLISTLTMGIMERTKEIGMMRCIGAKSKDIRRMFSTEGVFLAFIGWIIGIPMGIFISWMISAMGTSMMDLEIPFTFPPILILYAGLIAIIGTAVIIQVPLLRATRFKPGDAIRYQ